MKKIYLFTAVFLVGGVFAGLGVAEGAGNVSCSAADVNKDGLVNIADLVTVARRSGWVEGGTVLQENDVNRDGIVNIVDLVLVARQFGANCTDFIIGDVDGDACVNTRDMVSVATELANNSTDRTELLGRLLRTLEHFGEGCRPPVPRLSYSAEADINGDFIINKSDFDIVTGQLGQSGSHLIGDVDGNGSVSVSEFVSVLTSIARRFGGRAPQLPDIQVTSVTAHRLVGGQDVAYTNEDITVGPWDTVVFVARVKNAGSAPLPARYPVRWFVQRVEVQGDGSERSLQAPFTYDKPRSDSPALGVGEVSGDDDFQLPWIIDPAKIVPGTYRFLVLLDQGNTVREISETDNNTRQFTGRVIVQATRPLVRGDINRDYEVNALDINGLERRIRLAMFFDYDGDGSVGALDARMLQTDIAGTGSVPVEKIKDVDGNGQVNALDVAILERSEDELDFDGDGVLGDGDARVLGEIITSRSQSSLRQNVSERVVFVPIQEKPAKAQGFASVLKSILWVIGE